ncbi:MAG: vitamin B12 dependent-methionine synthase activation domain-containing protein [bacterium]
MGENEITRLEPQAVSIDHRQVLRLMGYPPAAKVAPAVTAALPRAIRVVMDLAEPIALHELQEVESATREEVRLASGAIFRGQRLAQAMLDAQQAALFVLTLGQRVSGASRGPAGADPFESFLFDSVASILVETVADQFQTLLEGRMNGQGMWGGFRYSPGYCDWPIKENRGLLQLLGARSIGVHLTAGGMMAPQKSISGIIGFGVDPEKIRVNPCTDCPLPACDHRRSARKRSP